MVIVNIPIITNNDAYSRVICMFSLKNHACFRARSPITWWSLVGFNATLLTEAYKRNGNYDLAKELWSKVVSYPDVHTEVLQAYALFLREIGDENAASSLESKIARDKLLAEARAEIESKKLRDDLWLERMTR
jgi:hypothetical protein